MDITPLVGVLGAIVGGAIGLLGQRMNLNEQRRKDQREKVVELLREADLMWLRSDRCIEATKLSELKQAVGDLIPLSTEVSHRAEYLNLTAPWKLQQAALRFYEATQDLVSEALKVSNPTDGQKSPGNEDYFRARKVFFAAREELIRKARPDIYRGPWWTTKPWNWLVGSFARRKLPLQ